MKQKVIRVGNSYAITIPKNFVDALKVSDASYINVNPLTEEGKIVLDFNLLEKDIASVIDPEVYKVGKNLLKRYLSAFKELAKK